MPVADPLLRARATGPPPPVARRQGSAACEGAAADPRSDWEVLGRTRGAIAAERAATQPRMDEPPPCPPPAMLSATPAEHM